MGRVDITVPMSEKLDEAVKNELEYGDSRAEWIRQAIRQRLERDGADVPSNAETDGGQVTLAD
jgi:metal-responsive CopG/Arc/MetJ family transcriptional regulator